MTHRLLIIASSVWALGCPGVQPIGPVYVAPTEQGLPPDDDAGATAPTQDTETTAPLGEIAAQPTPQSVRFVYLVSADRPVREDYRQAIETAAVNIQAFYADQLGGMTFELNNPVVEVAQSNQIATWFYANPNGDRGDDWGYNNGLAEARRLLGAGHGQEYIWVIYSDGPGNSGRGGGGVSVMPEDDLLGLIGQHPIQKGIPRWIGGLGHELGHALGLPHPPDSSAEPGAIMGGGFYQYPNSYLTTADKATLTESTFINYPPEDPRGASSTTTTYHYDAGRFVRTVRTDRATWREFADDGGRYQFVERPSGTDDVFLLDDTSRHFLIRIPVVGGMSSLSIDGGATWRHLYKVSE